MRLPPSSLILLLLPTLSPADVISDPELQDPGIFIGAASVAATMIATDRRGKDFTPDVVAKAVKQSNDMLKRAANPVVSGKTCEETDTMFQSLAEKFPMLAENLEQAACHDFIDRTITRATIKEYGQTTEEAVEALVGECPKFKKSLNKHSKTITDSVKQIVKSYSAGHCRAIRKKKQEEEKAKKAKEGDAGKEDAKKDAKARSEENIKEL